jgi:restriction endonuclease
VAEPVYLLAAKLGSARAADRAILRVAEELGVPAIAPRGVSAALALTRLGVDLARVARLLTWKEFEEYCALAISAAGYAVRTNVRLRKPTRQIDILAESPSLVLSVDCKHWGRGASSAGLQAAAAAQIERTEVCAKGTLTGLGRTFLPVLLTMVDNQVKVVKGVPVVPLQALREFLASVSRFDQGLCFIEG